MFENRCATTTTTRTKQHHERKPASPGHRISALEQQQNFDQQIGGRINRRNVCYYTILSPIPTRIFSKTVKT
jgi:hypothetical protein